MSKINGDLLVQGFHLNLKPEQLAVDPTLVALGATPRIWGNSTDGKLKYHNGTEIVDLTALGLTEEELTTALEEYVKTTDLPAPVDISGLATKVELTAAVADFATETQLTDAVAPLATKVELTTATQNLVSQTVMQGAIDNALAGLDFQADVLGLETDFVDVAGRYIYVDGSKFTTGVAASVNDIVEVSATGEILSVAYDVSAAGPGALSYNRAEQAFFRWNDTNWAEFGGLTAITNGNGLDKVGDVISVKAADATIVVDANGVKVGDLSATYVTPAAQALAIADFATDAELTAAVADLVSETSLNAAIADLATKTEVTTAVADLVSDTELATTLDLYLLKADAPEGGDISGLATKEELTAAVADLVSDTELATSLDLYLLKADVPEGGDISGLATKEELGAVVARIEASEFQFTPQAAGTTIEVVHNFGNKYPIVQVVDTDDTVIGVDEIKFVDVNTLTVKLAVAGTPKVIVQGLKAVV